MTTLSNPNLHNPHLDGDSFFLPGGPVGILLSHGYTATAAEMRPLAEKLHEKGYTVAGPLLAGHGTTPQELNRANWQEWVANGQELLDRLFETCEQVWVGGESMGGVLALYLAAKNPKVKGLLLYAPAIKLTMTPIDKIKLYLVAPFIEQNPRSGLDNPDKWQGYPAVPLKGVIQLLQFQKATLPLLPKVTQPVLIFQGRLDGTTAPQAEEIIMNNISSTIKKHYWMEKSHHTLILDVELDEITARTIEFIEKNS